MIQESGLTLAYIGDAIYELKIREYLVKEGIEKVNNLHNEAIKYTSAKAQSDIMVELINTLSEEEILYYKRGRNSGGTHKPKHFSLKDYREATGFESLLGALFLEKRMDRLAEIIEFSINFSNCKNREN